MWSRELRQCRIIRRRRKASELPGHRIGILIERQLWAQVLKHVFSYLQFVLVVLGFCEPPPFGLYLSSLCFTSSVLQFKRSKC